VIQIVAKPAVFQIAQYVKMMDPVAHHAKNNIIGILAVKHVIHVHINAKIALIIRHAHNVLVEHFG